MSLGPVPEEAVARDANGNRISLHSRVYVPERESNIVAGYMVSSFGGIVEAIEPDEFWGGYIITVREFGNWNVRSVYDRDCKVQHGRTKASVADADARDAVKTGKPVRRKRRKK